MLATNHEILKQKNDSFFTSKKTIIFKKNQMIYNRGENLKNIYIILDGLVKSFVKKKQISKEDMILNKGSTLGLMDLILNRNYSKYMIAKNTSLLAIIDKNFILKNFNVKDYRFVLIKSLALDIDTNNPNIWS